MSAERVSVDCEWSPQRVDLWLRNWQLLVEYSNGGIIKAVIYDDDTRGGVVADPFKLVNIKIELERALTRLYELGQDPKAARWIHACYIEGRPTTEVAQEDGVTPGWVAEVMARGRQAMARTLGWHE